MKQDFPTFIIKLLKGFTQEEYVFLLNELNSCRSNIVVIEDKVKDLVRRETHNSEYLLLYNNLINRYGKHATLEIFMDYLNKNIVPETRTHRATTFVRNQNNERLKVTLTQPCHKYIYWLPEYKIKYLNYIESLLSTTYKYKKIDELIYDLNLAINKKILPSQRYRTDQLAWGTAEVWESCDVLYDVLVDEKKGLDCDSIALFKYYCFYVAAEKYGLFDQFYSRTRLLFCQTVTREWHLNLAFIKEGVNDWIVVETTWFPDDFEYNWNNDITISGSGLYPKIFCSFDMDNEYVKLL